jgi:hypothetical protein
MSGDILYKNNKISRTIRYTELDRMRMYNKKIQKNMTNYNK